MLSSFIVEPAVPLKASPCEEEEQMIDRWGIGPDRLPHIRAARKSSSTGCRAPPGLPYHRCRAYPTAWPPRPGPCATHVGVVLRMPGTVGFAPVVLELLRSVPLTDQFDRQGTAVAGGSVARMVPYVHLHAADRTAGREGDALPGHHRRVVHVAQRIRGVEPAQEERTRPPDARSAYWSS